MRLRPVRWILPLAVAASPLGAQASKATVGKLVPVSDVRPDWLDHGIESPNGRFFLLTSYATNDSGFLRYDRVKKSWSYVGRGNVGAGPRWSPNGRFVSYVRPDDSGQWHIWLVPMDTATGRANGPARRVSTRPGAGPAMGPAVWSPDSRRVAYITQDSGRMSVLAVPFNGGDEQVLFEAPGILSSVIWARDGRSIFVNHSAPNRTPRTLRVSLDDKRSTDLGAAVAPIIDISADGRWLAQYVWYRPVLHLLSTDGQGARQVDLNVTLSRLSPAGWSRTNPNEFVALNHFEPTGIQRVSIADGRIQTVVAFDSAGLGDSELSPDDRQLAYIRLRDGARQLVVADTNGGNARVLVDGAQGGILWSPTGQHIAYTNNETDIQIVDVSSKKTHELLAAEAEPCSLRARENCDGRVQNVVWRSDGRAVRYFERRSVKGGRTLELREVDLDGRQRVVGTTMLAGNPSFIARNDTLFLVAQPNAVQLVNARTGSARVIYSGVARAMEQIDASGQWIFLVADSGGNGTQLVQKPLLVSLTTGESKTYPYALGGEVSHGRFLADGRNFLLTACLTCKEPNYTEKWDLILTPMNGDPPRLLTGSQANFKDFWPIAVTKDGRFAYFVAEQSYNTRIVTFALPRF